METETTFGGISLTDGTKRQVQKEVNGVTLVYNETIPCAGGHKVDGKTPMLHDIHLDQRTCDCQRMKYIVEGCGCPGSNNKELHGHPNQ